MTHQWYCQLDDGTIGPVSWEQVQQLVRRGRIQRDTPIRKRANGNWLRAGELPSLGLGNNKQAAPVQPAAISNGPAAAQPSAQALFRIVCKHCQQEIALDDLPAGEQISCPCCKKPVRLLQQPESRPARQPRQAILSKRAISPATDQPEAGGKASASNADMSPWWFGHSPSEVVIALEWLLGLGSLLWLAAVVNLPALAHDKLATFVTIVLITTTFFASIGILLMQKRIPILPTLVQVGLFTLLHYQVFTALGSHHYQVAGEPGVLQWLFFIAAHAVHAVDVLDFLHGYGIHLQPIRTQSVFAGLLTAWLHVSVDLLVIGLIRRAILAVNATMTRDQKRAARAEWLGCFVILLVPLAMIMLLVVAAYKYQTGNETSFSGNDIAGALVPIVALAGAFFLMRQVDRAFATHQHCLGVMIAYRVAFVFLMMSFLARASGPLRLLDWVFWPLDNALRTVDIADLFQIFDWRLHRVDANAWTSSAGFGLRLLVGLYLAEWVLKLRMSWNVAFTPEDVLAALENENADVRLAALRTLREESPDRIVATLPVLVQAFRNDHAEVRRAALRMLLEQSQELKLAGKSVVKQATETLVMALQSTHKELNHTLKPRGLQALRQTAANAAEEQVVDSIAPVFGNLGPEAIRFLCRIVSHGNNESLRGRCADILRRLEKTC